MKILSLSDVPQLKELAKKHGYDIHVRDACGGQSFSLEEKGLADKEIFDEIENFFIKLGFKVHYYDDKKLNFTLK